MCAAFVLHISNPGPRPPYYLVAEHLWGTTCDIDSDGNSQTSEDTGWTELTIALRRGNAAPVHIDPVSPDPLVLEVRSQDEDLCRKAALFIVSHAGGTLGIPT